MVWTVDNHNYVPYRRKTYYVSRQLRRHTSHPPPGWVWYRRRGFEKLRHKLECTTNDDTRREGEFDFGHQYSTLYILVEKRATSYFYLSRDTVTLVERHVRFQEPAPPRRIPTLTQFRLYGLLKYTYVHGQWLLPMGRESCCRVVLYYRTQLILQNFRPSNSSQFSNRGRECIVITRTDQSSGRPIKHAQ